MPWVDELTKRLAAMPVGGYGGSSPSATEPISLACLALTGAKQIAAAQLAADWLVEHQQADGFLGVTATEKRPCWPTSLAVLAWRALDEAQPNPASRDASQRGLDALLQIRGATSARIKEVGHDTTLVGWPWVEGTHSWLEPTAFAVQAMKRMGLREHERTREAVRVLHDRQFPIGGCNYGNTFVLGQELDPHVQPTGIVLLALADEPPHATTARSATWLENEWPKTVGIPSLCCASLALAAFDLLPSDNDKRLEIEWRRINKGQPSTYQMALLTLAQQGRSHLLISDNWL